MSIITNVWFAYYILFVTQVMQSIGYRTGDFEIDSWNHQLNQDRSRVRISPRITAFSNPILDVIIHKLKAFGLRVTDLKNSIDCGWRLVRFELEKNFQDLGQSINSLGYR